MTSLVKGRALKLIFFGLCALQGSFGFATVWTTQYRWSSPLPQTIDCENWVQIEAAQTECRDYQRRFAEVKRANPMADWEDIYSMWVEHYWRAEIYSVEESALEGIATDCAKASYSMRIYFSYLNHLEFRTSSGLSNSISTFDRIKESVARFQAYVRFVLGQVSTRTLSSDTYPIDVSRAAFRPGIVYNEPGGHSFQIGKIDDSGSVSILESSRPIAIRILSVSPELPGYVPKSRDYKDGFRKFMRPEDFGKPFSQLPHYSLKQFEISKSVNYSADYFTEKLSELLRAPNYDPESFTTGAKIRSVIRRLCTHAAYREKIVLETDEYRPVNLKCIQNRDFFEDQSTYSRDHILDLQFRRARELYKEIISRNLPYSLNDVSQNEADTFFATFADEEVNLPISDDKSYGGCFFKTYFDKSLPDSKRISLRRIWQAFKDKRIVPDPNATYFQRWGLEPYKAVCPILEEIHQ